MNGQIFSQVEWELVVCEGCRHEYVRPALGKATLPCSKCKGREFVKLPLHLFGRDIDLYEAAKTPS